MKTKERAYLLIDLVLVLAYVFFMLLAMVSSFVAGSFTEFGLDLSRGLTSLAIVLFLAVMVALVWYREPYRFVVWVCCSFVGWLFLLVTLYG